MFIPDLFASLPDDRAERLRRVAQLVEAWWSPLGPADGVPEDELCAAERRLGVRLPAALREAYALLGQRVEITTAFDRMVPPRRLRRSNGVVVLWHLHDVFLWVVREGDLGLPDPPLFVREKVDGAWQEYPALPRDPSVSRFFAWKALEQATEAGRYENTVFRVPETDAPDVLDPLEAEVSRRFALLDFGTVAHPPPASRLYGGEDVLIIVGEGESFKVAASNLDAYRRAMETLRGVPARWGTSKEQEAFQGEFADRKQGLDDMELLLQVASRVRPPPTKPPPADERAAPAPAPPPADDRATGAASDLDPRLSAPLEKVLAPYAVLLPPGSVAHVRAALEMVVETWLRPHVDVLLGKRPTDDVAPAGRPPALDPATEAKIQALGLTPEQRDLADAFTASGALDEIVGAVQRRYARMERHGDDPAREPSEEEELDEELASIAEETMNRFLLHLRAEEPADRDAAEAELCRVLRLLAASMFVSICAALFALFQAGEAPDPRYSRATLVTRKLPRAGQDERIFVTYYLGRKDLEVVALELGVPVDVEHDRQRAYLERVAALVEASAAQLGQPARGRPGASAVGDLIALMKPRREP